MLWVRISIRAICTTLCDKVCQWLATGRWFSPGPPVSSTKKNDSHDITEILLKVTLSTINQTKQSKQSSKFTLCNQVDIWFKNVFPKTNDPLEESSYYRNICYNQCIYYLYKGVCMNVCFICILDVYSLMVSFFLCRANYKTLVEQGTL
jgi:hypothetical protein